MIFYILFGYVLVLGWLGKTSSGMHRNRFGQWNGTNAFWAFAVAAFPTILVGLRTSIGDTGAYINSFKNFDKTFSDIVNTLLTSRGAGWNLYILGVRTFITQNANLFLLLTAIVQFYAVVRFYYFYSSDFSFSFSVFFLSFAFLNTMNGLRQFFAVSMILLGSNWLFEKKYVKFCVIVFLASLVHISAIIWFPCVFIVRGKPWNFRVLLFSAAVVLAIVYLDEFTDLLEESLADTTYEGYTNQFLKDDGSNIMHTIIAAVPVAVAFLGRKRIAQQNDGGLNTMVNISVLGMMVSALGHFTSGILVGRMPIYFTVFNFALLPNMFSVVFDKRSQSLMKTLAIGGYIAFALYYLRSTNIEYNSSILGLIT